MKDNGEGGISDYSGWDWLKVFAGTAVIFFAGFLTCAVYNAISEPADLIYTTVHWGNPDEHGHETSYVKGAQFGSGYGGSDFAGSGGMEPMTVERELMNFLRDFKENKFLSHPLRVDKPVSKITIKIERKKHYSRPHWTERLWP